MASKRAGSPSGAWLPANSGLMPMRGALQVDGQRDGALDGAAARLAQLQDHVGLERPVGLRQRRQLHGDVGLALGVGGGQALERLAHGRDLLVGEAEAVAGKARQRPWSRLDDDLAFDGEAGGRRPIEIAAGELDDAGLLRGERLRRRARA